MRMYDKYNRHRLTSLKLGKGKHNYLIGLEHNITIYYNIHTYYNWA